MTFLAPAPSHWLLFLILNTILNVNFVIIYVMLACAKKTRAPKNLAGSNTATPAQKGVVNPSGSASTTPTTSNTNNVKFADHDDPKNKSTYGVDDAMFKRKKVEPVQDKEKLKKDMEAEMSAAPSREENKKKSKSSKDGKEAEKKAVSTAKATKEKKKDDSDKTDLRSLTLERNLLEAKTQANQKKNPAAVDRSAVIESPVLNSPLVEKSKYAAPKPAATKQVTSPSNMPVNSQKQNRSAYL